MLYLNERDLKLIGINWIELVDVIEDTVRCLEDKDYAQPIKPYLRYRDLKNRIIAMPAFVGGKVNFAGIKWIASFPDNIEKSIPRAHSVVILNDSSTGQPVAIINTPLLSILRTAAVSGLLLRYFDLARGLGRFNLGILGWGPIGRNHFKIITELYRERIAGIYLYDIRGIDMEVIDSSFGERVHLMNGWEQVFDNSDVFITCTVSKASYINKAPKKGSLQLNVSLRDYTVDFYDYVKNSIIVDEWEEVCRENTDIENMYKYRNLQKKDTAGITDVVCRNIIAKLNQDDAIMFNPMGMAVFDIVIGAYYFRKATEYGIGTVLE